MNGIHDLGGMHGFGPVNPERAEPMFHARWEARALAVTIAMGAWGRWNLDASRYQRELIPPSDYLRLTYYERWIAALEELMVAKGLVTRTEIVEGRVAQGTSRVQPPLAQAQVAGMLARGAPTARDVQAVPHFQVGDRVRARNLNPTGHTRLPRYVRGKAGEIHLDHGVHVYPDSNAHFQGEDPRRLYSVRFAAQDLWGPDARRQDAVYLDLWEPYLDPV